MTKRICVIGNAELLSNSTQFVDNSEVVIRINDCKNYTGLSGRKTDLVFVNNTGEPARRLVVNAPFQNQELFSHVDKFVFVRDIKVHRRFLLATEQERYLNLIDDHADEIVHHNEILSNRTDKLSKKFNLDVFRAIWQERKRRWIPGPFIMPSTGIFAVMYAVGLKEMLGYDVTLIGFTFHGWKGHPWSSEKRLCAELANKGILSIHHDK